MGSEGEWNDVMYTHVKIAMEREGGGGNILMGHVVCEGKALHVY